MNAERVLKQEKFQDSSDLYSVCNEKSRFTYLVKMPLKYHLITYLKLCSETIIIPLFFAGYVGWLLQIKGINLLALLPFAIALSLFIYYLKARVVVDTRTNTIRLRLFLNNNKNVIKYDGLCNLSYVDTIEDIENLKNDKSKFVIATPYCKNDIDKVIKFDLKNNVSVIISVNKPQELYEILKETSEE